MPSPPEKSPPEKRAYDATRRRERAEEEREETRRKVVDAARRLFVSQGYTATKVSDIAEEAGVALQSVYKSSGSKAELLVEVTQRAVVGDDRAIAQAAQANVARVLAAQDPHERMRLLAGILCDIVERSAPIQAAYREAAAVDPAVAENLRQGHQRRWEIIGRAVAGFDDAALTVPKDEAQLTVWTLSSADTWQLQAGVLGRTPAQVRAWVTETLTRSLLAGG
jgi:AcrR family transcriptional regulator